jgi:hypothetical protein
VSARLRELSRHECTTLPMTVLAVYAALLHRWGGARDIVVPVMTAGRLVPEVDRVIGLFACPLFLRLELLDGDRFVDLLRKVTAECSESYDNHDAGRIAGQVPAADFAGNPAFNWIPQEFGIINAINVENADHLECCGVQLKPMNVSAASERIDWDLKFDRDPHFLVSDSKEGIVGRIVYSSSPVTLDVVKRFERNLRFFASRLSEQPLTRMADISCIR